MNLYPSMRALGALLAASWLQACGPAARPAVNLDPRRVDAGQGAMFGQVSVTNEGETVTESCYVFFTDDGMVHKAHFDLDESGWIFAQLPPGRTHLSEVRCVVGGFIKHVATYRARSVAFDVPGSGQLSYFGHVTVKLNADDTPAVLGAAIGGLAGALISQVDSTGRQSLYVDNKIGAAARELKARFGSHASALKLHDAVGGPSDISKRTPRNPSLLFATSDVNGLKLTWLGQPKIDPSVVALRFQRFGTAPELASCAELALDVDGMASRYPLQHKTSQEQSIVRETVQAVVPIETLRALTAASRVRFDLCGLQRELTPRAADEGRQFLADFVKRAPAPVPAPQPPVTPEPAAALAEASSESGEPATAALEVK